MSETKDRKRKLLAQSPAVLNGIDFVVVANARKTAIEVHFLTAAPIVGTITSATITGGQTSAAILVTSMDWSVDTSNRPMLTLNVAAPGASSTYTLSLAGPVLDPYFSQFQFSFTAGAPSTLDCKMQATVAQAQTASAPPIDYLAKDFLSFRKALSDFSAVRYPAWQERSEADFGVMFMEALCALADDLSYQQDRVAAEAYLATATERLSVVRHARLVNYEPTPALAASVLLQFTVGRDVAVIPPGLAVNAFGPDGSAINFETGVGLADAEQYLANPEQYLASTPQYRVKWQWNRIVPYWWDDSAELLPAGATEMWVYGHGLCLIFGVSLLLDTMPGEEGEPNIRETVQIKSAEEQTDQLYNTPVTRLQFLNPLAQQHNLAATTVKGNLIPATQGLRHAESFAIDSGPASAPLALRRTGPNQTPLYLYTLANAPLTWLAANNDTSIAPTPEILVEQQLAPGNDASVNWPWYQSLLDAPPFALGFTIDPVRYAQLPPEFTGGNDQLDYDGSNGDTLRFGDGVFGELPTSNSIFTVVYRAGAGSLGNVTADSITTIDPAGPLATLASAVSNPFPAQGGADAQSIDTIVRLAPYAYQSTRFNAVLPADYEAAAKTLPWVERAGCTFRYTGSWVTAFTVAEPVATDLPTGDQTRELSALLDRYRMAGRQSYVLPTNYLSLDLQIFASAKPDSFNSGVAASILQALGTTTLPNGSAGFFQHSNFAFGQPLERSALESAIQNAQGVAGVASIRYRRFGANTAYIEMADQVKVGIDQIIRVDNNPTKPDGGSISVIVGGGK
jgi:hypothetical protein